MVLPIEPIRSGLREIIKATLGAPILSVQSEEAMALPAEPIRSGR